MWSVSDPFRQRSQPGGQRLAAAGRRVHQPRLAGEIGVPDLALEIECLPTVGGEPALERRHADVQRAGGIALHAVSQMRRAVRIVLAWMSTESLMSRA